MVEKDPGVNDERRCLVVDDHPLVRLGVRELLNERYQVDEAEDGEGALRLLTDVGDSTSPSSPRGAPRAAGGSPAPP